MSECETCGWKPQSDSAGPMTDVGEHVAHLHELLAAKVLGGRPLTAAELGQIHEEETDG